MGKTRRSVRLAGAAAAIAGAGVMAISLAAPASAAVSKVEVTTPSGYGSTAGVYGPGCSYTVEATVDSQVETDKVAFSVSKNGAAATSLGAPVTPTVGSATVSTTWTPTSAGSYKITAKQGAGEASTDALTVGTFAISNENLSDGTCIVIS
ncbi:MULTISPECIES: hypothetical protein [unclassified Gordonia (in: high G+C Gram-positive bacteria)]